MNHRIITIVLALFILSGCATLPPLQEMSNARQTISAAKELSENAAADEKILEAERLLARAQRRIEVNLYDSARQDALRAQKEAIEFIEKAISENSEIENND
ncbi:MAG: hypothetical protein MK218_01440 [Gammaproteobacteria bacterium]|nr:hypothetical protein [Gammaproteobacteria bacterium]MDC0188810.1 hypothetical protein [Gammaproteobacteria bacterium]MDG2297038.1 hypothetical protein [Gammaproteobacteria bacterium]|tara:strand:+ start:155 stop:460 length:306 start_codon:yes stop_codon:yes gene_type:complete